MTYKQKLKSEHPEMVDAFGECKGCPITFGYEPVGGGVCAGDVYAVTTKNCKACWNREMGEKK